MKNESAVQFETDSRIHMGLAVKSEGMQHHSSQDECCAAKPGCCDDKAACCTATSDSAKIEGQPSACSCSM